MTNNFSFVWYVLMYIGTSFVSYSFLLLLKKIPSDKQPPERIFLGLSGIIGGAGLMFCAINASLKPTLIPGLLITLGVLSAGTFIITWLGAKRHAALPTVMVMSGGFIIGGALIRYGLSLFFLSVSGRAPGGILVASVLLILLGLAFVVPVVIGFVRMVKSGELEQPTPNDETP